MSLLHMLKVVSSDLQVCRLALWHNDLKWCTKIGKTGMAPLERESYLKPYRCWVSTEAKDTNPKHHPGRLSYETKHLLISCHHQWVPELPQRTAVNTTILMIYQSLEMFSLCSWEHFLLLIFKWLFCTVALLLKMSVYLSLFLNTRKLMYISLCLSWAHQ